MTEAAKRPLPYDWKDVRERLQKRVPTLLARLGISNRDIAAGAIVTPCNPTRNDRHAGSFVIWTSGDGPGAWKDYATGEQGDVFDLIAYLGRLQGKMDVYWWALDFLELEKGTVRTKDQAAQDRERAERDRLAFEAKRQEDEDGQSASLMTWWLTLPPFTGTVAEAYLTEARGIPLSRLAHQPGALRFAAQLEHFDKDTGELTEWPAMVAAMTKGSKFAAVHRTWLQPDGSGKAPVAKAKMMKGPSKGAAIRLSSGPSGLSPTKAAKAKRADPLLIGEGIETTLTAAAARPDYRAWAAGSLSLLALLEWPACASAVILLRDNDLGAQAIAAFEKAEAHWRAMAAGRQVKVVASPVGKDFNDWATA